MHNYYIFIGNKTYNSFVEARENTNFYIIIFWFILVLSGNVLCLSYFVDVNEMNDELTFTKYGMTFKGLSYLCSFWTL